MTTSEESTATGVFTGITSDLPGSVFMVGTNGALTITDSRFENNVTRYAGGAVANGTNSANLIISGTTFLNNHSVYDGGAIGVYKNFSISNSIFIGNTAQLTQDSGWTKASADPSAVGGGAISLGAISSSEIKSITNTLFKENVSGQQGGAIGTRLAKDANNSEAKLKISASFESNHAFTDGGAIYNTFYAGDNGVEVSGIFTTNKADRAGGAIYNDGALDKSSAAAGGFMTITDSTFTGNVAGTQGGAIYNSGTLTLEGTNTFKGNIATDKGNDIYNTGTVTIKSGTTTLGSYEKGNAFVQTASGTLTLNGGTLVADLGNFVSKLTTTVDGNSKVVTATLNDEAGISDASVIGTKGNLNLRADGLTYTSDEYQAARAALFGQSGEEALLTFVGATLELTKDAEGNVNQQVVAGVEVDSSGMATLTTGPVVVDSKTTTGNGTAISSVADQTVKIVADGSTAAGNLLDVSAITANNSAFVAKDLQINGTAAATAGGVNLTISGTSNVTLVGTGEGSTGVVNTNGDSIKTNVTVKAGTLNMGLAGNSNDQGLTLESATVNGGELNANGGEGQSNNKIGTLNLNGGKLNALNSSLIIEKLQALKGTLFIDPAYVQFKEGMLTTSTDLVTVDAGGKVTVGSGSVLETGTVAGAQDAAQEMGFNPAALSTGFIVTDGKAVLVLGKQMQVTGGLVVDGTRTTTAPGTAPSDDTATFADNSLLVVDGNLASTTAALKAKTVTVDDGAKLYVTNAKVGEYTIAKADTSLDIAGKAWDGANLGTDNKLVSAVLKKDTATKTAIVTTTANDAKSLMPGLDSELGALVNNMTNAKMTNQDSNNFGERFVNRAVNRLSGDAAAKTIEGAAKMALAGAVPQMGMNLANAAGNIAGLRNSLSAAPQGAVVALNADGTSAQEGLSAGDGMKNGLGLWVMPTYQNQQGFGFESGDFETGYKSNAAGVALGADYTFNDMFRVGAQFNVGGGYAESTGDFNSTDNRFNYWGLGLYAGYQYQNFGLTADFGYSANNNELEQSLPSAMQMAKLKADAKTDTITAGLRGEYKITTDALDIVPHLGVRMTNMHMDSFNVKSDKHKVFKADDMNATVWTFPVGVTFSKDIETSNGWTIKPSLDLAIIPAAGDIEAKQDIKIVGVNGTASMESNIMDAISYQGSLGLSAKNDNGVSVGVNYTLQASQPTTDHGVQATFRYEF